MTARLFAVECRPRLEQLARTELMNQHFPTLLPMFIRPNPRRLQSADAPLFPGYLFVQFDPLDPDEHWGAINGTRGVRRLLCSAVGRPAAVPERRAAEMWDKYSRGPVSLEEALLPFAAGAKLRVTGGFGGDLYAGWEGICKRRSRTSVVVMMLVFGRDTEVELPIEAVEVVRQAGNIADRREISA